MTANEYGFDTLAIHAGQDPDPRTGAVVPPIYQTSTYAQDAVGSPRLGYEYSRSSNPTRDALQDCLAAIEGGRRGLAFASGLAAEDTLLRAVCRPGDHVVIPSDAYGGTYRLFAKVAENWGLSWTAVPLHDLDQVRAAFRPGVTKLIWAETPTNPLLSVADVAALAGPTSTTPCWWWTTRSPRPTCSSRSRWAPTWSCTRRRNTWVDTPMWSAAR